MAPLITRIIIADDHQLFADGVEQILSSVEYYQVIGKASNGKVLIQMLNNLHPDLVLMDINMPFMDGMESAMEAKKRMPHVKIIFLSMYYNARIVEFARKNKINGFILKNITAAELKEAIGSVLGGRFLYALPNAQDNAKGFTEHDEFMQKSRLSPREIEIIQLIKAGKTTKQIADDLNLSTFTIETHRKNIFRKLEIKNMAELVAFASQSNL